MSKVEFQYTRLYLKKFLVDNDDPRKDDADFINSRGAEAEEAYEKAFLSGLAPNQAKEVAMKVLMEGIELMTDLVLSPNPSLQDHFSPINIF